MTTETPQETAPPVAALPPPVTDFGMVRFEAMGHRYREGRLSAALVEAQARAEAAERKLAAVETYCRTRPELAGAGYPQLAADILAITGSEEAP